MKKASSLPTSDSRYRCRRSSSCAVNLITPNHQVLKRTALQPDSEHEFVITPTVATEARLELYYEGGLSRVLFFGELAAEQLPERPNLLQSATISHVSNEHYGKPEMAVHGERQVMHMSGWESARTGFGERALFSLADRIPARRPWSIFTATERWSPTTCPSTPRPSRPSG